MGFVLDKRLDWNATSSRGLDNITICTVLGTLGAAIGAVVSGKLAPHFGTWRTLLVCNILNLVLAGGLKQVETTVTVMMGRTLFGVFCGIQNFCFFKALNDYVPAETLSYYSI